MFWNCWALYVTVNFALILNKRTRRRVFLCHKSIPTKQNSYLHPRDPTPMEKKCGVVYKIQCGDWEEVYIGETARPFGVRFREHVNSTRLSMTAVGDHLRNTRHPTDLSSSLIVLRKNDTFKRRIREAIEIHCQAPTMNHDVEYELPAIFRHLLSCDSFNLIMWQKHPTPLDKDSLSKSKACAWT